MAKITDIDCMKFRKSTHLAGIDVETIQLEKGKCILTIKEAYYNENVDVSGNKTNGYFIEFEEDVKDMVVNSTNRKVISTLVKNAKNLSTAESRNIKNWTGLKIELFFDATIQMMKKTVGGIRINESFTLPKLELDSKNFEACKKGIENGYTMDQIKLKYIVSKEVEEALLKP
jgi:hypothetical protein